LGLTLGDTLELQVFLLLAKWRSLNSMKNVLQPDTISKTRWYRRLCSLWTSASKSTGLRCDATLLKRLWFERAWVIQEMAVLGSLQK
jgi:hypothetical protein